MFTIRKEFAFSAAHSLKQLPEAHPCSNVHGHNYVVTVELSCRDTDLSREGFVTDYRRLDPMKRFIDDMLDHKDLNAVLNVNPTAENIAQWLFNMWHNDFPQLKAVEVSETPKTVARYEYFF